MYTIKLHRYLNQNGTQGGSDNFDDLLSEAATSAEEKDKNPDLQGERRSSEATNEADSFIDSFGEDLLKQEEVDLDKNPDKPQDRTDDGVDSNGVITSLDVLEKGFDNVSEVLETDAEKIKAAEIQKKAKQYEEIEPFIKDDPIVSTLIEYKKAGHTSWADFNRLVAGEDLSEKSDEEVFRFAVTNLEKIEDESEVEDRVSEYMSMGNRLRKERRDQIVSAVTQATNERIKKFGLDIRTDQEIRNQHKEKAYVEMESLCKNVEGKKYCNVVITPEMNAEIKKAMQKEFAYYDPRNGYEIRKSWDFHFWSLYKQKIVEVTGATKKHEGRAEIADKVVGASQDSAPRNRGFNHSVDERREVNSAVDELINSQNPQ